ncbi:hypothetical protein ANCCAN_11638 [Ancylostoma caninum]|uniref:Secreted protein n=1 Tax=Ancylostoma caninum TaxID=29170 RepID=A0A368GDB2_ANCCA|nr:hypothetical protein ANCCAN_11638 [Ancylostoma caninum]
MKSLLFLSLVSMSNAFCCAPVAFTSCCMAYAPPTIVGYQRVSLQLRIVERVGPLMQRICYVGDHSMHKGVLYSHRGIDTNLRTLGRDRRPGQLGTANWTIGHIPIFARVPKRRLPPPVEES